MKKPEPFGPVASNMLFLFINTVLIAFIALQLLGTIRRNEAQIMSVANQGRMHYMSGGSVSDNPYMHTVHKEHWVAGWLSAREEDVLTKKD